MGFLQKRIFAVLAVFLACNLGLGHEGHHLSGFGLHQSPAHHHCGHGAHHHDHDHHHHHHHGQDLHQKAEERKLPEELAEEEDLKLYGFGVQHGYGHELEHEGERHGVGLWVRAMGCSLLVSLASLICLIILPIIFIQGKPSKAVVDSLAVFGAGAMLGDAFLHQLPHAFGGEHSHSHDHNEPHLHSHLEHGHSHSHSLKDLSVGLSILVGIVLFLLVEKLVRYVEGSSGGAKPWGHSHHHHHKKDKKLKDNDGNGPSETLNNENESSSQMSSKEKLVDEVAGDTLNGEKATLDEARLRKRNVKIDHPDDKPVLDAVNITNDAKTLSEKEPVQSSSNLVFGYLNLFSDGVHNFTDGMALGSAFLLYGSVGGWSRTLFLLAHELPQEVGDFGILVRSGFSVSNALFFNFLSALVALAGTALALLLGQDPGQSSLIEGFTAGGFIYIAVAGVLAEMNNNGDSTLRSAARQLTFLILGMMVALGISLIE